MKRWLLAVALATATGCQERPAGVPQIDVYFSPRGGCTDAIVDALAKARRQALVQAYSFTSAPVAKALVAAHRRGVKVEVVLDSGQKSEKYSSADFLVHMGIAVRFDGEHAIAHNKVIVIDDEIVVTGSFNFSKAAESSNAENLLVIRDAALAARYAANWREHARHSEPYQGKTVAASDEPPGGEVEKVAIERDPLPVAYVASANSAVFHRPGCRSVGKIAEKNVVAYDSRDEAVRAGKKPCAECRP